MEELNNYNFPVEIKNPKNYIEDIKKYGLFMAESQVWVATKNGKKTNFKSVSNFEIKILQHIQDEKQPLKLIFIKNVFGKEAVFDVQSDKMNTQTKFDDTVTCYGNYLWLGSVKEFRLLRAFLFDKMKTGKKIECLGWNEEFNFWVWNNLIVFPSGEKSEIDKNGIFNYKNHSIYIPSANQIYKNNESKFMPQKSFEVKQSSINLNEYLKLVHTVFKNDGIISLLFTFSSMFQDIITKEITGFPILFLQGGTSTGKDQLAITCQSFFGDPQKAINVESGVSTAKAHIREFAQFRNSICQFSEYKTGDKQLDGILKGLWDRNGYKRGTIESNVATDTVPILSALVLTGNHSPDDEALITRLLWLEMNKSVFSEEEIRNYNNLKQITAKGISQYTNLIIPYRNVFISSFRNLHQKNKTLIDRKIASLESRFSTNYAVLLCTYEILSKQIDFSFSFDDVFNIIINNITIQKSKLSSVSISEKWWTCFSIAIETTNFDNRIEIDEDLKIEGDNLYFYFSKVYNKIQRIWFNQFKSAIPNIRNVQNALKKEKSFIATKDSFRIGKNNSSAYQFNLFESPIKDDISNFLKKHINNPTLPTKT